MRAYDLAIQNFAVAEHLLNLHQLFRELQEESPDDSIRLAVCRKLKIPEDTIIREARNDNLLLLAKATAPIPASLLTPGGTNFLLRQAVVVACTSLESFFWDALRENVLTIVRARRRGADESLRKLTLTLDDYLSMEGYSDPDERLKQIILKNFERGALYDSASIEKIATVLTVRDFWKDVSNRCGMKEKEIRRQLDELINRRNQVAHRADRPDESAKPAEETDGHGLREINYAWVNQRIATARSVVEASAACFAEVLARLEQQLEQEREQQLARKTLERGNNS